MRYKSLVGLLAIGFCLLSPHRAPAQDTRGTISGTITDSQAAVIAGAAVTVSNTGTGAAARLSTNSSGYYEAPLLLSGSYSVSVEMAGFKRLVRSGLTLGLGEQVRIDLQLEVGGATESEKRPTISGAWQRNARTIVRGGYGIYYDTLNVLNQAADQYGFARATNTVLTTDFGVNFLAGDPRNGVSPLSDPFPVRRDGTRFDAPLRDSLGAMARAGQGFTFTGFDRQHPRLQRWRMGNQRELSSNMMAFFGNSNSTPTTSATFCNEELPSAFMRKKDGLFPTR